MKVPYSWIKEFLDIDKSVEEVVEKLNETGLETTYETFGEYIPNLLTVKIKSIEKHPEKDKLFICRATDGNREYQIITGADNVKEDAVVILAKTGAEINGIKIKERQFGSYLSQGMFLSLEELGLSESSDGILLLPEDTPLGVDASKLLGLGKEKIIEVDITPNRADALSVRGLAREIGAVFNIKKKEINPQVNISYEENPSIEILTDKCKRYRGVIIKGVEIKPSPLEIQLKLIKAGQRPINNIVDITNYILLQEGQPLHAFDLDKLKGEITVREAREGEKVLALDGNEYQLKDGDIVITDEEKIVALGGIIGCENSKVDENTKNILLEGANFNHIQIRRTSKRVALTTESSYRFERGVDIEHLKKAQDEAVRLIISLAGGKAVGEKDLYPEPYKPEEIKLRELTTKRVLGINIPKEEAKDILNRLEIPTEIVKDGTISKIPPFRALDLEREIDLVEEVGRIKGFNNVEESYPSIPISTYKKNDKFLIERLTRDFFISNGLTEVITYSFVGQDIYTELGLEIPSIRILNYLSVDQSVMRDNLAVSLIKVQKENLRYQIKDISIFEIGSTFFDDYEEIRLGLLLRGKYIDGFREATKTKLLMDTNESWDFLKLKGLIHSYLFKIGVKNYRINPSEVVYLNRYESADISVNGKNIGYFGKVHPEVAERLEIPKDTYLAELKLIYVNRDIKERETLKEGYLLTYYLNRGVPTFRELPKYPSVKRDLAFEIDKDIPVEKVINGIKELSKLVETVKLFDIYHIDENRKSIAVSVEFRAEDKSLSDEDVNEEVEKIISKLAGRGIKLREYTKG